jgi:hypothetical protein
MDSTDTKPGKTAAAKAAVADVNDSSDEARMVVVDLGKKQSGKKIRRLRKGQGSLMADVKALVDQTKENLGLKENAVPIVIVVEKKRNNRLFW